MTFNQKEYIKKYQQTEHGHFIVSRADAKRKGLGFKLKYENILDESFEYHHINKKEVVAVPKDLHKGWHSLNHEQHRFIMKQIIKQIYKNA